MANQIGSGTYARCADRDRLARDLLHGERAEVNAFELSKVVLPKSGTCSGNNLRRATEDRTPCAAAPAGTIRSAQGAGSRKVEDAVFFLRERESRRPGELHGRISRASLTLRWVR
jgi:hypothetical protein